MPAPQDVHHSKFPVEAVLYDDGDFAIAWGSYDGGPRVLGVRWNGGEADAGYPKLFGNPVWMVIPGALTVPIVSGLVARASADQQAVIRVLETLRESGALAA
jgi:hypothetical protein